MGFFSSLFSRKANPEGLVPWVHRLSHFAVLAHLTEERGPLAVCPVGEALAWTFAIRSADGPIPLRGPSAEAIDQEEASRVWLRDFERLPIHQPAPGVVRFGPEPNAASLFAVMHDGLSAALPLKGAPVAFLATDDCVLLAGEDDPTALASAADLAEQAFSGSGEFRSLRSIRFGPEGWEDYLPPDGHPLQARYRELASRTLALEAEAHGAAMPDLRAPIAPLAALPASEGGWLVAAWARGTEVFVPGAVDEVVVLDGPRADCRRARVRLQTLVGTIQAPPSVDGPLGSLQWLPYGTFPTAAERRYMLARDGHARAGTHAARKAAKDEVLREIASGAQFRSAQAIAVGPEAARDDEGLVAVGEDGEEPGCALLQLADGRHAFVSVEEARARGEALAQGPRPARADPGGRLRAPGGLCGQGP